MNPTPSSPGPVRRALAAAQRHRALIVLTFELFWIVVFLLSRYLGIQDEGTMQFVYTKF